MKIEDLNQPYDNWMYPDEKTMKADFDEYKLKEFKKWEGRAKSMGFRFPIFNDFDQYKNDILNAKPVIINNNMSVQNLTHTQTLEDLKDLVSTYYMPRDVDRIVNGMENNIKIPYPVILKGNNGYFIMSGNTRLNVCGILHGIPKALIIDVSNNNDKSE